MIETLADKLYRTLQDENSTRELQKLPPDTYHQVAAHIKTIRGESSEKERNLTGDLSAAERKILSEIAQKLIRLRIEKYKQNPEVESTNLTLEERYIVEPLLQSTKRLDRIAESIFNGQVGELAHASSAVKQKYVYARFTQPYSAITGVDLGTYGPFEVEDVAILPLENAKNLVKNGIISPNWVEPDDGH